MRLLLFLLFLLTSCTFQDNHESNIVKSEKMNSNNSIGNQRNEIVINELKRVKAILSSKQSNVVSQLFKFPVPDSIFDLYIEDSNYLNKIHLQKGFITKDIFTEYFQDIYISSYMPEILQLLQNVNIDSLAYKDKVEKDCYKENEPCYYSYSIEVNKFMVLMMVSMNSNKFYNDSTLEEIPSNSSEICEHSNWWNLELINDRLIFKNLSGAD